MESLKRVGEVVNRCIKNGKYIKNPDNDIIEYHYINVELEIDKIGTSFHPDVRKGSIHENNFKDPKVEEEMFWKPLFTVNQKDNRGEHFWCDMPGCKISLTATNKH